MRSQEADEVRVRVDDPEARVRQAVNDAVQVVQDEVKKLGKMSKELGDQPLKENDARSLAMYARALAQVHATQVNQQNEANRIAHVERTLARQEGKVLVDDDLLKQAREIVARDRARGG